MSPEPAGILPPPFASSPAWALISSHLESIALTGLAFRLSCPSFRRSSSLPSAACFLRHICSCHHSDESILGGSMTCKKSARLSAFCLAPLSLPQTHAGSPDNAVFRNDPTVKPSFVLSLCQVGLPVSWLSDRAPPTLQGLTGKPLLSYKKLERLTSKEKQ